MATVTCIEDLRQHARRKVPKMFFDYVEAGSYAQETLRANRADLERIKLRQRVLVDVSRRDLTTTIIGETVPLPLALAPIGLAGMQHPDGEIAACRAAQAAGIPFTLSTMSVCSIEDVAEAVDKPFWFQLYVMKDRGFARSLIERAAAAKCSALVLTIDLQVLGQRHCDVHNGLSVPPEIKIRNVLDIMTKPSWAFGMLRAKRKTFGNLSGYARSGTDVKSLSLAGSRPSSIRRCHGRTSSGSGAYGPASSFSRACSMSTTRGSRPRPAQAHWWSPTTAAASSTARRPRSPLCRRSSMRWAARSR